MTADRERAASLTHVGEGHHRYALLGALLDYPRPGYHERVQACCEEVRRTCPEAAEALGAFAAWVAECPLGELEERFTRTFDVSPVCFAYVSIYLFGEESHKRGALMAQLNGVYQEAGFAAPNELPDHLSVLLRFLPAMPPADRAELIENLLLGPAAEMAKRLAEADSPYHPLLRAVHLALESERRKEHADG